MKILLILLWVTSANAFYIEVEGGGHYEAVEGESNGGKLGLSPGFGFGSEFSSSKDWISLGFSINNKKIEFESNSLTESKSLNSTTFQFRIIGAEIVESIKIEGAIGLGKVTFDESNHSNTITPLSVTLLYKLENSAFIFKYTRIDNIEEEIDNATIKEYNIVGTSLGFRYYFD
jgi:hypothetical protein